MNWIKYIFMARAILKIITDILVPDQDGEIKISLVDAADVLASLAGAAGIKNEIVIDARGLDFKRATPKIKQ